MRHQQIVDQIRSRLGKTRSGETDAELLRRFITCNDQNSFAILLDRYAGMVMGVCRRIVGETHLAEDVFQATFLVLSKKAKTLRDTGTLPAWLHRVALRLALRSKRSAQTRQPRGLPIERLNSSSPLDDLSARELLAILDEELNRLTETHRTALILCCFEGRSQEEAAHLLGCSPGSIKGRLERGRMQLRDRLTKRGLIFSGVVGIPLMVAPTRSVSAAVLKYTLASLAPGHSLEPAIAALVQTFTRASLLAKLKITALSLLLLGGVGFGVGVMSQAEQPAVKSKSTDVAEIGEKQIAKAETNADTKKDLYNDPLPDGAVLRLGTIQRRAVGAQLAMTADGKSIVTFRGGKYLTIWDAETGERRETRTFPFDSDSDEPGWLSPDGRWLATDGGNSSRLILVDLKTGKSEREFAIKDSRYISSMGFSRRGDRIAAVCSVKNEKLVKAWDVATGKELLSQVVPTTLGNNFVAFTPDGKAVIAKYITEIDSGLMCWDIETNKVRWQAKECTANCAVFTPDSQFMLASFFRPEIDAINVTTGQPLKLEKMPSMGEGTRMRFLPDGKRVVVSKAGGIVVWDRENGRELQFLKGAGEEFVVAPDGKSIVTNDGSLQRWNLETGKPIYTDTFDLGHIQEVIAIKFTVDGKHIVSASKDGTVRLWDALTGKPLHVWTGHQAYRPVKALDISPDGRWIVSVGSEEKLIVRDASTEESRTIELSNAGTWGHKYYNLRVTPDGREAVVLIGDTAGWNQQLPQLTDKLTTWDLKTGELRKSIPIEMRDVESDFAANRRRLIHHRVVVDVATGKEIVRPEGASSADSAPFVFSAGGSRIIGKMTKDNAESGVSKPRFGGQRVWESTTGKPIADLPTNRSSVGQAGFHPNHRLVFISNFDGITFWDLVTKKPVYNRPMPEAIRSSTTKGTYASCVAFSPDGSRMATGHPDGTILIWDLPIKLTPLEPIDAKTLETIRATLESADAANAWELIWRLSETPAQALPALRKRLKPIEAMTLQQLQPMIAGLDDNAFTRREQAMKQLRELGPRAEAGLREAKNGNLSEEQRKRVEQLLTAIRDPKTSLTPTELGDIRAVHILAQLGTHEAKKLLKELAKGAESARLTQAAKDALELRQ